MYFTLPYLITSFLFTAVMVNRVMTVEDPPFRPAVPATMCSQQWSDMMQECWDEIPAVRPTFATVLKSLKVISGRKSVFLC